MIRDQLSTALIAEREMPETGARFHDLLGLGGGICCDCSMLPLVGIVWTLSDLVLSVQVLRESSAKFDTRIYRRASLVNEMRLPDPPTPFIGLLLKPKVATSISPRGDLWDSVA